LSTQVSGIVQQFGFATIPSCSAARAPFTSGTTSGTPSRAGTPPTCPTTDAPPHGVRHELARRRRADREEAESRSPAESLGRRLLDDERLPPKATRPADRSDANARTSS
jgi:hypothetical protein